MLKLLTNITSIAEESSSLVSNFYQLLKFIINNVSTSYAVCGFIIVLCMFATTFKNLIYKVLNLAVLSVFVVALWAYLTDVTFIYVVYILTFVSAVVMLFLSVVLMLPSSAIAVSKRNFSALLLFANTRPEINGFGSIGKLCLIIGVGYFMYRLLAILNQNNRMRFSKIYRNFILVYSIRNTDIGTWVIADRTTNFFERALRAFNNIIKSCRALLSTFKLHPAIVFKLAAIKDFNLPIKYLPAYYYNSIINFIFINIEAPKYSMTGCKCGFHFLTPYYDSIIPVHNNNFPVTVYSINPTGRNNKKIFYKNFFMFISVNGVFNIANTLARLGVVLLAAANIELMTQVIAVISIFFIALPFSTVGTSSIMYSRYLIDAGASQFAENLEAIQQGLYVHQPLLLLVCITGLLVALIGAPFFVSRGNR